MYFYIPVAFHLYLFQEYQARLCLLSSEKRESFLLNLQIWLYQHHLQLKVKYLNLSYIGECRNIQCNSIYYYVLIIMHHHCDIT